MGQETKNCQNCKADFVIEPEDFDFYKKIDVPPPTFCPECRRQRRITWRNQMNLHPAVCALCSAKTVSMYSGRKPFPIYCSKCWWGDNWDPTAYARDYDFSKDFFTQFRELTNVVPHFALQNTNGVNSEYCNYAVNCKNCYFCFSIANSEDAYYCGPRTGPNRQCIDCTMDRNTENCFHAIACVDCYQLRAGWNCRSCVDSYFLRDCKNCQNCVASTNLRNAQYCIFNEQYTKEEYRVKLRDLKLQTWSGWQDVAKRFREFSEKQIYKYANIENSTACTGDDLTHCRNCENFFAGHESENCKHIVVSGKITDSMDVSYLYGGGDLFYEVMSMVESSKIKFSVGAVAGSKESEYFQDCAGVDNCFGCVGLKKKQFCILNKQYSREEYFVLRNKIVAQMKEMTYQDSVGRIYGYGEFFPPELSPFAYNESLAQEYFPLTEVGAKEAGYEWVVSEGREYQSTVLAKDLPDNILDTPDSICNEVIGCSHDKKCNEACVGAFRILPQELNLHKTIGVPLPRECPKCRAYARIRDCNPFRLWIGECACTDNHATHAGTKCSEKFQTPYDPSRSLRVYCETCYNSEVA